MFVQFKIEIVKFISVVRYICKSTQTFFHIGPQLSIFSYFYFHLI